MTSTIPSPSLRGTDPQTAVSGDERSTGPVLGDPAAADAIIAGLRQAIRELRCIASQKLLRRGLSMAQFYVLSLLDRHGELPMSRLADVLGISVSNATGLVDRIEERGLVQRVRTTDDRRVVLVRITEGGSALLAEVDLLNDDLVTRVLAQLDAKQLGRARLAMADIAAAVGHVAAATGPEPLEHRHPASG